jgi:DNA-binding transcriptional MerR regulator
MATVSGKKINTDKLFYKIGEVSDIADLEPHVLRYWESEFPFLKPRKNKTGQRIYTRKDLELVLQIKDLLYKERYTIAGVKKKLSGRREKPAVSAQTIQNVRKTLKEILNTLNRDVVSYKPRMTADREGDSQLSC